MKKDFVALKNYSKGEILALIKSAVAVKKQPGRFKKALAEKCIGLLFQKPSLRTKTAFYVGALQLGASPVYFAPEEIKVGQREKVADVAKTTSGYLDAIVMRTFSHQTITDFAKYGSIPVVNGLSDLLHPSQALADVMTILECKKTIAKSKVVFIGDGNNVCNSLMYAFAILGGNLVVVCPKGYGPKKNVFSEVKKLAKKNGAKISVTNYVSSAAKNADVLYTDVWTSMGKEKEAKRRKKVFKSFQINDKILKSAKKNCIVMHCLPAHRGEEITDSVIDGKHSVVFQQAENRLYAAKAILLNILKAKGKKK